MSVWSFQPSHREERLLRLESLVRAQYALMLACVIVLALTGLPQKFESLALSRNATDLAGGIENLRLVHHVAGGALVLAGVYHVVLVLAAVLVLKETAPLRMVPGGRDLRDAMRATAYFAGLRRERPGAGGRRYFQKIDYWFLAWSLGVMAVTGFVNLFPLRVARLLSSDATLAALRAHSDAAPLVLVWVVIVHLMYTGLTPRLFRTEESRQLAAAPATPAVQPLAGAMGIVSATPASGGRDAGDWEEST
jgi:cytochrome b subunit of formate dehydrogenase